MTEATPVEVASAPQSASLSDLETLWGAPAQNSFADESTRAYYLANGFPLLLSGDEQVWQQPLCA